MSEKIKQKLEELIKNPPAEVGQRKVLSTQDADGIKFNFSEDDWLLLRFSGTVPAIRCYAEAGSKKELKRLISSGLGLIS